MDLTASHRLAISILIKSIKCQIIIMLGIIAVQLIKIMSLDLNPIKNIQPAIPRTNPFSTPIKVDKLISTSLLLFL